MTDTTAATTAAPQDRYTIGDHGVSGCYVIDRVLDERVSPIGLTWAAAHCEAQRLNREARAGLNKPAAEPVAPSCDCAEKLEAARATAERYRQALAMIWRRLWVPPLPDGADHD